MNRYDLAGRTAIVTGGAGGIGRAVASALISSGARVSLWDRDDRALETAVAELGGEPDRRVVDITDAGAVDEAARQCHAQWGRIDILVNNAGILGEVKPVWESDPDDFRRVLEVNLVGAYLAMRAVVALMRGQAAQPLRGHVVNVASIQGKEGMPRAGAYSASKAGLIALTKSVARETAEEAISVTCITPAAAETSMAKELTSERRAEILARIPMRRFVAVEEIARLVLWLSSDDCSFSTGGVFDISGGRASY
ncbi:SDR family oxidoreductase [Chelatococcus daeguensis]|uniref:3-oxoacyl-ACP reductase n=2 Tax=Chelatococcus TaxID=28209 RepID=A0AAC9JPP8_9HYPH|nr:MULTISPECIES: SDR family NAD(P)-dependent oxidoreductase [Chelatococcus]APF36610.1 3-oxoacyl-ACP reductase [Chelatococcus daeguensis]KZE33397.1 3-oxoacyl-ACP reductase [Chelatococcus daeguensis]MBM3082926.1 SDR family oxidoreductase [Chelatococcus daeguensis]CUA90809.1 NAD(P)-dependent dehydrogenase, short-chain alcohol dehydrogenase family [Chelatococcus sambhunathii]